ncbi:ATP-binding protein [Cloacibacterium sp.]|uniref:ATP-binding protein n=1 Tax=Cloacibacterium sp. TaxID=1913682 RepID=UPI0039E555C1
MISLPENVIQRPQYIEKIIPFIGKNLIKVFTGQRRVGKSFLLFQIIKHIQDKNQNAAIIYINKEDLQFSEIDTAIKLQDYILKNKSKTEKTYVFIDEIQDIQDFEKALRSLLLYQDLDLYCTGSNANLLSSDIAGNLSGRFIEIIVYSLSYTEFLDFHQLEDSSESLDLFLKFGGLPYLKHLELKDEIAFEYLKNVYSTIVFRDVVNRYSVRNTTFLEQLVLFLADNTGSIFSAKKISDFLKSQKINIAPNQVQVYIQHLVNAFIIHKVPRYDILGKRIFEIGEKFYFENLGIRNSIWGYRIEDRAKIIENAVYNHLLFKGYTVTVGNLGDKEIDFIAEKNAEKLYIQVALTLHEEKTIEREFGNLKSIPNHFPKIVISLDSFSGASYEGIKAIDLRTFLNN